MYSRIYEVCRRVIENGGHADEIKRKADHNR